MQPAGQGIDVRLQWSVESLVVQGMIADDVDDGGVCAARVVQVRQSVSHAWAEVQQRRGGPFGHTAVAVCRAGRHTLEQGEHSAHLRHRIERRHEVHLRGTRVGEADIHAAADQRADKGLCTIHGIHLQSSSGKCCSVMVTDVDDEDRFVE
jgi:hypothetical protein